MTLKIERLFGLVSVAMMGLVAIACVPQASTTTTTTKVENHESAFPIELEVDSVRQVELMNSQVPQFTTGPDVVNGH